jgi:hypothetical protein
MRRATGPLIAAVALVAGLSGVAGCGGNSRSTAASQRDVIQRTAASVMRDAAAPLDGGFLCVELPTAGPLVRAVVADSTFVAPARQLLERHRLGRAAVVSSIYELNLANLQLARHVRAHRPAGIPADSVSFERYAGKPICPRVTIEIDAIGGAARKIKGWARRQVQRYGSDRIAVTRPARGVYQ